MKKKIENFLEINKSKQILENSLILKYEKLKIKYKEEVKKSPSHSPLKRITLTDFNENENSSSSNNLINVFNNNF